MAPLSASSVAVSMLLLVVLLAAYRFLSAPAGGRDRTHLLLVVSPRTSMMMTMPIAYQAQIAGLPGVAAVSPFGYFGAHYGARDSFIPAMAFDPEQVFAFFRRWKLPASERRAFIRERTALIAGRTLAEKFGWKVGDRIHLTATMNRHLGLDFTVQGIYDAPPGSGTGTAVFHWNYMNEALGTPNRASEFWVLAKSARDVQPLRRAIDDQFRSAPVSTRTGTLKQVMLNYLALLGNVKHLLLAISFAVVFAVVLIMANTMAMSIRERTSEIATLRALGWRRRCILELLAAESVLVSLAGTLAGCLLAAGAAKLLSGLTVGGEMPARIAVDPSMGLLAAGIGVVIGLGETLIPAWSAAGMNIARALRDVG